MPFAAIWSFKASTPGGWRSSQGVFLRLIHRYACPIFGKDQLDTPVRLTSVRAVVTGDGEILTLAERGDLTTCNIALHQR
jgi:hypothetical protein